MNRSVAVGAKRNQIRLGVVGPGSLLLRQGLEVMDLKDCTSITVKQARIAAAYLAAVAVNAQAKKSVA